MSGSDSVQLVQIFIAHRAHVGSADCNASHHYTPLLFREYTAL